MTAPSPFDTIREALSLAELDRKPAIVAYQDTSLASSVVEGYRKGREPPRLKWEYLGLLGTVERGAFKAALADGAISTVQRKVPGGYALLAWRLPGAATAGRGSAGLSDAGRDVHRRVARSGASQ